ncbi:MAG: isocitrate lyase/phosphoenolpyruvate mutase family protein [Anaerolineales bacterium]
MEAGADCVFPIELKDANTIAQLVREIDGPINILASEGVPSIDELETMGVRRVSFGSSLIRSCLGQA